MQPYKYGAAMLVVDGLPDDSSAAAQNSNPPNQGKQAVHTEISLDLTSAAARSIRKLSIGAVCAAVLALAMSLSSTTAVAEPGLQGLAAIPPAVAPDTGPELENSASSGVAAGVTPQALVRSACLLPFFKITYPVYLDGKGTFKFLTTPKAPPKGFNVVMTLSFPGFFSKVNKYGPGKAEALNVRKSFAARVNGKVTISGVKGSYGCFVLKITP